MMLGLRRVGFSFNVAISLSLHAMLLPLMTMQVTILHITLATARIFAYIFSVWPASISDVHLKHIRYCSLLLVYDIYLYNGYILNEVPHSLVIQRFLANIQYST